MKPLLKDIRLGSAVFAAAAMLVGVSPSFVAFAQTTPPPAAGALTEPIIKSLQEALNKQGMTVKVDGVLSDETRIVIRRFQTEHHLPVTGEPDKATLDKLGVSASQTTASSPAQPTTPPGQAGMGGMPMMSMMSGMMSNMPMMNMMGMMRMMGPGMAGMETIDRVEGRIAFLRTELKITEAQSAVWDGFADALRTNAKKLGEVRGAMMAQPGAGQQQAPTMAEQLDLQERWLLARLEGTRAIRSAFTKLYEALSDDQKNSAKDLMAPHMGMMTMMPAQMQPGQMQPGQMQPGQIGPSGMQPGQMGPGRMQPGQMGPAQMGPGRMQPGGR